MVIVGLWWSESVLASTDDWPLIPSGVPEAGLSRVAVFRVPGLWAGAGAGALQYGLHDPSTAL